MIYWPMEQSLAWDWAVDAPDLRGARGSSRGCDVGLGAGVAEATGPGKNE